MAMYIRVKRMKATYFIQCDPTETVLDVKQKLSTLIEQPVSNLRLVLMSTEEVLEDSKSLAEQMVENDAVVALTLKKDGNEFEDVDIAQPTDFLIS
ncbi:Ubiquitin-like superfamily protein [Hirschfeldia incana]|nr:Ubiquitin-like superfamily protein [Hirschfeldia incana]